MILAAEDVTDLQCFLLDAVRRYDIEESGRGGTRDLLSNAAALDYVLLLSTEPPTSGFDDDSPIALGVRETLARAATAALDFVATIASRQGSMRRDFRERQANGRGLFAALRRLRERGALHDDEVAFRAVTLATDLIATGS